MVWSLELTIGYLQKLARKISGMSVAFGAAIIPQPMQVRTGCTEIGKEQQDSEQDVSAYSDGSNHAPMVHPITPISVIRKPPGYSLIILITLGDKFSTLQVIYLVCVNEALLKMLFNRGVIVPLVVIWKPVRIDMPGFFQHIVDLVEKVLPLLADSDF